VKQANDHFTQDLLDTPKRGRPRVPNALTAAERAKRYRDRKKQRAAAITVLFARRDSFYKTVPHVDVYDADRNAMTWPGGSPIVAHPPCRSWGSLRHFAKPRPGEKELALWAVDQVRKHGGVLEHPAASTLWPVAGLPRPGERDEWGGWSLLVSQVWWGHRAEKKTLLYIVGCEPHEAPALPRTRLKATHVIARCAPRADGTRQRKGDPSWRPEVTDAEREHTPPKFALWLLELARRCRRA
jgi:hypothetical protein